MKSATASSAFRTRDLTARSTFGLSRIFHRTNLACRMAYEYTYIFAGSSPELTRDGRLHHACESLVCQGVMCRGQHWLALIRRALSYNYSSSVSSSSRTYLVRKCSIRRSISIDGGKVSDRTFLARHPCRLLHSPDITSRHDVGENLHGKVSPWAATVSTRGYEAVA